MHSRRTASSASLASKLKAPEGPPAPPGDRGSSSSMGVKPAAPGGAAAAQPSWGELARAHAASYATLAALVVLLALSEHWRPYHRVVFPTGAKGSGLELDDFIGTYSYPLVPNAAQQVPAWAVPCIAVFTPLLALLACLSAGRITRSEAHVACLLALTCVATTGLLTNWIKVQVGRPRPHFVQRCWPGGAPPAFTPEGRPKCLDASIDPEEGIKSWPSGHTSWSTSGLGYLTFWLMGHLRAFDGSAQPQRFIASLAPLLGAVWIGLSRIQDYWHHVEDVMAGFALGLLMAWCFYRQAYPAPMSCHAGVLTTAVSAGGGGGGGRGALSASPSRFGLLQGVGGGGEQDAAPDGQRHSDDNV